MKLVEENTVSVQKCAASKFQMALVVLILVFSAAGARATVIDLTINDATFSATCVGGSGTCTEVVNGSLLLDTVTLTKTASAQLTGTLTASLVLGPPPSCVSPNCLGSDAFYDSGVLPSHDPIEFGLVLNSLAPTNGSVSLVGLQPGNPTVLYVPALCGGDQPNCNAPGSFPGGGDYALVSGTYSIADINTPEPNSVSLLVTGVAMLGFMMRRVA
jgi:hypothetical protein